MEIALLIHHLRCVVMYYTVYYVIKERKVFFVWHMSNLPGERTLKGSFSLRPAHFRKW
jgi:hypothetical protein